MQIRFWGVRGSMPTPLSSACIKEKITAILEQVLPEDIASAENREHFIAGLPPWLFGTIGGNSPCVSINLEGLNEPIIFDCGSGLRDLGNLLIREKQPPSTYHIFFSHFHWDHIQGIPFFIPAYNKAVTLNYISPVPNIKDALYGQMAVPYFPVPMDYMAAKQNFIQMENTMNIESATVACKKMSHPGDSYAYVVSHKGKRVIYATDTELSPQDFEKTEKNIELFKNADVIILDSQYTVREAVEKYNWGHSAISMSVDFAVKWGIKHLVLFHHDPSYDDRKLYGMLHSARWYLRQMEVNDLEVTLATEGLEILL